MSTSLRLPVIDLRRRPGSQRDLTRRVPASDIADLSGVAGTVVPADGEIEFTVTLESVPEGLMVFGTLVAPWEADCRRCLEPVTGTVEVDMRELFEHDPTPGDTYPIQDDTIDLEPMVRDSLLLGLPLSVVCSDECPGPDPERFPASVETDEPTVAEGDLEAPPSPAGDPRWAALGSLRFDD